MLSLTDVSSDYIISSNLLPGEQAYALLTRPFAKIDTTNSSYNGNKVIVDGYSFIDEPKFVSSEIIRLVLGIVIGYIFVSEDAPEFFIYDKIRNRFTKIVGNAIDRIDYSMRMAIWRVSILIKQHCESSTDNTKIRLVSNSRFIMRDIDGDSHEIVYKGGRILPINSNAISTISVDKPDDYENRISIIRKVYGKETDKIAMALFECVSPAPRKHIFIMSDDGGSGKTTLMRAFQSRFNDIIGAVRVQAISGGAFERGGAIANLIGKKAFIADEGGNISSNVMQSLASISTGIDDDARFGSGVRKMVHIESTPIIATNSIPDFDKITAFKRRAVIINILAASDDVWNSDGIDGMTVYETIASDKTIDAFIFLGLSVFIANNGKYESLKETNNDNVMGTLTSETADLINDWLSSGNVMSTGTEIVDNVLWSKLPKCDREVLMQPKIGGKQGRYLYNGDDYPEKINTRQRLLVVSDVAELRKLVSKSI